MPAESIGDIEPQSGVVDDSPSPQPGASGESDAAPIVPSDEPVVSKPARGPVPFDRHEEIVRNTRRNYTAQLDRLAWATDLDPRDVQRALALDSRYQQDPHGLHSELSQRIRQMPGPDWQDDQGRQYYSPERAAELAEFKAQQIAEAVERRLEERLGPIEQYSRESQNLMAADAQIEEAQHWPGWDAKFEGELADVIAAARHQGRRMTLHEAYITVVVPKLIKATGDLRTEERKAVLHELAETSREAADTVNPQRRPSARVRPDHERSLAELIEESMRRPA